MLAGAREQPASSDSPPAAAQNQGPEGQGPEPWWGGSRGLTLREPRQCSPGTRDVSGAGRERRGRVSLAGGSGLRSWGQCPGGWSENYNRP